MSDVGNQWRFLIDANLPPALCDVFRSRGYRAAHVHKLGMGQAPDLAIWKRCHRDKAVIVTKDRDFASLAMNQLEACPVIFVRSGNLRRGALLAKFKSVMQNLIHALDNGDKIIEIA
jgi:predicted nuclease of predicted toxin-antitoxin system